MAVNVHVVGKGFPFEGVGFGAMNSADYWMENGQRLRTQMSVERHKNWELGRRVEMLRARVSETEWKY